jgi:hypothetical protein
LITFYRYIFQNWIDYYIKIYDTITTDKVWPLSNLDTVRYLKNLPIEDKKNKLNEIQIPSERLSEFSKVLEQNDWGLGGIYSKIAREKFFEFGVFAAYQINDLLHVLETDFHNDDNKK